MKFLKIFSYLPCAAAYTLCARTPQAQQPSGFAKGVRSSQDIGCTLLRMRLWSSFFACTQKTMSNNLQLLINLQYYWVPQASIGDKNFNCVVAVLLKIFLLTIKENKKVEYFTEPHIRNLTAHLIRYGTRYNPLTPRETING